MKPVVSVLVDAFRHDYLDERSTPVIADVVEQGSSGRIRPILGYSDSIRATIFTGAYPDETGYWMEYCWRPASSPFAALGRLGPLDAFPSDFGKRGLKWVLSNTVVRSMRRRRGYRHLSLRHIPFRVVGQFDWTLARSMTSRGALGRPTFFDDLTEAGIPWRYLASDELGRDGLLRELDRLDPATGLAFVYLHHIDMASHLVGLRSPFFRRVVKRTDALVGEVLARARRRLGDVEVVLFSDHGLSEVGRVLSYDRLLRHPGFPSRFVVALDATMVRVWWIDADEQLRGEVRSHVESQGRGRFLTHEELRGLHLDFGTRLYGDEIYLLEPGDAIFPNFHSMLRPKAMHAYHPDGDEQQGIFVGPRSHPQGEIVDLVRIAPLVRTLTGVAA